MQADKCWSTVAPAVPAPPHWWRAFSPRSRHAWSPSSASQPFSRSNQVSRAQCPFWMWPSVAGLCISDRAWGTQANWGHRTGPIGPAHRTAQPQLPPPARRSEPFPPMILRRFRAVRVATGRSDFMSSSNALATLDSASSCNEFSNQCQTEIKAISRALWATPGSGPNIQISFQPAVRTNLQISHSRNPPRRRRLRRPSVVRFDQSTLQWLAERLSNSSYLMRAGPHPSQDSCPKWRTRKW